MDGPVIPFQVQEDVNVFKGPCIYYGALLLAGASAASTIDFYDGTSTSGVWLDRLIAGIAETKPGWRERGIACSRGIYVDTDANFARLVVYYRPLSWDELQQLTGVQD